LFQKGDAESAEQFKQRGDAFEDRFRPIVLREKIKWLAENKNNPKVKSAKIAQAGYFIKEMEKAQEKWQKKEAKQKKKEKKK